MSDILHRIGVKQKSDKVYEALTTIEGLSGWWTPQVKGTPDQEGGVIEFRFGESGPDMEVRTLILNKQVEWLCTIGPEEWLGTRISFFIQDSGDETIVLFGHRDWQSPSEFMAHCSCKWAAFLISLKEFLESGKGKPYPDDLKVGEWG